MISYLSGLSTALAVNYSLLIILLIVTRSFQKIQKRICLLLLLLWFAILLWITVFSREVSSDYRIEFRLFHDFYMDEYKKHITVKETLINYANNILLFVPCGLLANSIIGSRVHHHHLIAVMAGLFISLIVEICQYLIPCGLCELDDLVMNTIGTAVGVWISGMVKLPASS